MNSVWCITVGKSSIGLLKICHFHQINDVEKRNFYSHLKKFPENSVLFNEVISRNFHNFGSSDEICLEVILIR